MGPDTIDGDKTKVKLAQAIAACVGVVGFFLWQQGQFSSIKDGFAVADRHFVQVEARLTRMEEILADRATRGDLDRLRDDIAAWRLLLKAQNPTMSVPESRR